MLTGTYLQIGRDPKVECECAIIAWYDDADRDPYEPLVAEFSFRYEDQDEKFEEGPAGVAYEVLRVLQSSDAWPDQEHWIDPESQTKTAYVYNRQR